MDGINASSLRLAEPVAKPMQSGLNHRLPKLCLVGPLPPPEGGMANQTRQLAELLRGEGLTVEVVRTNMPYSPSWIAETRGARAVFRLFKYAGSLWSAFGRCDIVHLMANSGWSGTFCGAGDLDRRLRGRTVVVNYRGGEAAALSRGSARIVRASLRRPDRRPFAFFGQDFRPPWRPAVVCRTSSTGNFSLMRCRSVARPRTWSARHLEPIYDIDSASARFDFP